MSFGGALRPIWYHFPGEKLVHLEPKLATLRPTGYKMVPKWVQKGGKELSEEALEAKR